MVPGAPGSKTEKEGCKDMTFYKIIVDNIIIAVGTTYDLRRVQEKHGVLVSCVESAAQYIQCDDTLYRDGWFSPLTSNRYAFTEAKVATITEDEYEALKEEIDAGRQPEVPDEPEPETPDEPEQPEEETPAKTRLEALEEQLTSLMERNAMLEECVLEMSEIVYA